MGCKHVAYLRRSKGTQDLTFPAQQRAVREYAEQTGCDVIAEYVETETGKKHDLDNRPELCRAIAHAKRSKATLVVAKLDRLLRSTVICNMLKTRGVKFVACDDPHANELTIDIKAAVAANEVREISKRTKAALAELKANGVILGAARPGAPKLSPEARERGRAIASAVISRQAIEAYSDIAPEIADLRSAGLSFSAIAKRLNKNGHTTTRGLPWNPVQVQRVFLRTNAP
jgi:DNA invertase Pin-like site-specific DNA recombinase